LRDPIEINFRNREERVRIHVRDATGGDVLDCFRAGEDALHIGAEMRHPKQAL